MADIPVGGALGAFNVGAVDSDSHAAVMALLSRLSIAPCQVAAPLPTRTQLPGWIARIPAGCFWITAETAKAMPLLRL